MWSIEAGDEILLLFGCDVSITSILYVYIYILIYSKIYFVGTFEASQNVGILTIRI